MNAKIQISALCLGVFALGVVVGNTLVNRTGRSAQASSAGEFVTGIGGVFFKAKDPKASREWYRQHLGVVGDGPGVNFSWRDRANPDVIGFTVWSVFPRDTDYFGADDQEFMVNYRVRDLDTLLARLEQQGVRQAREIEKYSYGRFAWIVDGDGRRVELWEPAYSSSVESR